MKLCGFEVGLDRPLFVIAGSVAARSRGPFRGTAPGRRSGWARRNEVTMKLCGFDVGLDRPLFVIAGPCVVESRQMAFDTAGELKQMTQALGISFIYKSSYDKANRSSGKSFRGLGVDKGL